MFNAIVGIQSTHTVKLTVQIIKVLKLGRAAKRELRINIYATHFHRKKDTSRSLTGLTQVLLIIGMGAHTVGRMPRLENLFLLHTA